MGCAGSKSKLDDLEAVALCKKRCDDLDEAIRYRFQLADSHVAYIHSLRRVALFFQSVVIVDSNFALLNLPPHRKAGIHSAPPPSSSSPPPVKKSGHVSFHSHSNSGSHLQFHSDDDDDDDISHLHLPHHDDHDDSSPLHHLEGRTELDSRYMADRDLDNFMAGAGTGGGGYFHLNYMKSSNTTPSVVYEQRPATSEAILHLGAGDSSSSHYPYNYNDHGYQGNNTNAYPYSGYSNYGASGGYYGYSASSPSRVAGPGTEASLSSKPPPPPPSPPRASTWEFLNLFESSEGYYRPYENTPSRDSNKVREEEGIPDLEDDEGNNNNHNYYQNQVVKEVLHGGELPRYSGATSSKSMMVMGGGDERETASSSTFYNQARPSVSIEKDVGVGVGGGGEGEPVEYDVHVVDKKVVDGGGSSEEGNNTNGRKSAPRNASEVAFEIKAQFERASASGDEVARLLEAGRQPHHRKHASKMPHGLLPMQPSTSKSAADASSSVADKTGQVLLEIDEELAIRSKNLSSTLHKLYLLEKKLYTEVKAEEKLRVAHEKNCHKLKRLDERGAEAQKVDTTQTLIRSLSTKMRMAIQVVDKISITINKIRDEELWPQLNELIQGLTRMWKSMFECHHSQCEAIREARSLGLIGLNKNLSDASFEAARELLNWTSAFSCWIGAQKGYVKALNSWLVKCLLYVPEETPDGIIPFSPGRLGAPPVFVICNHWAQAMDRISEKEVVEAMSTFAMGVLQLCERDNMGTHQRVVTNKDLERKARTLDSDQKIQKEIQALEKQIIQVAGDGSSLSVTNNIDFQSDSGKNLQVSLERMFEAMDRFASDLVKVYEELVQRSEEETLAWEHERVS